MTLTFDPSTDLETITDGLQAVTVKFPGSATSTSVTHALRRAVSIGEAEASKGRYTTSDVNWRFPQSECPTRPPLGSKIVDASGVYWTVLNVDNVVLSSGWRCMTRALEVVAGLNTTIRIDKAKASKGLAGEYKAEFFEYASLKARIQEVGSTSTRELGLKFARRQFRIIVSEEISVDNSMRVVGDDGTTYQVDGYEQAERIDALPVILASTDPYPEV